MIPLSKFIRPCKLTQRFLLITLLVLPVLSSCDEDDTPLTPFFDIDITSVNVAVQGSNIMEGEEVTLQGNLTYQGDADRATWTRVWTILDPDGAQFLRTDAPFNINNATQELTLSFVPDRPGTWTSELVITGDINENDNSDTESTTTSISVEANQNNDPCTSAQACGMDQFYQIDPLSTTGCIAKDAAIVADNLIENFGFEEDDFAEGIPDGPGIWSGETAARINTTGLTSGIDAIDGDHVMEFVSVQTEGDVKRSEIYQIYILTDAQKALAPAFLTAEVYFNRAVTGTAQNGRYELELHTMPGSPENYPELHPNRFDPGVVQSGGVFPPENPTPGFEYLADDCALTWTKIRGDIDLPLGANYLVIGLIIYEDMENGNDTNLSAQYYADNIAVYIR